MSIQRHFDEQKELLVPDDGPRRDALTGCNFSSYAIGHVYNDLCATAWFSYLLFFLTDVVFLDPADAGFALLAG